MNIIRRIGQIFGIEDPAELRTETALLVADILAGNEFPKTASFYIEFIRLCFDVLYPDIQPCVELLRRSAFTRDEFERAGFDALVDIARQADAGSAEDILRMYEPERKRRKVSWGANLAQISEIERTVLDPAADYSSSAFVRCPAMYDEWIVPEHLDCPATRSAGLAEEERRESASMRMRNTEEHRTFTPRAAPDCGEEGTTIVLPVMSTEKSAACFDFRKIVEEGMRNAVEMGELLDDPKVVQVLFCDE